MILRTDFSKNYDKKLFDKFKSQTSDMPIGIYQRTPNYIAILELSNIMLTIPVLNTYNASGDKIISQLIYDFYEPEPGFSTSNTITLNPDAIKVAQPLLHYYYRSW